MVTCHTVRRNNDCQWKPRASVTYRQSFIISSRLHIFEISQDSSTVSIMSTTEPVNEEEDKVY